MMDFYQSEPFASREPAPMMSMSDLGAGRANPVKNLVYNQEQTVFAMPPADTPNAIGNDKLYQSLLCRKQFEQKSMSQGHLRSHVKEGDYPYRCNICSKTFAIQSALTYHYRTHTGEKPYQCEYCYKSFSLRGNLNVHRRIHTEERPYKCNFCGSAFAQSGKMNRHMEIHAGEWPHKCSICSKTFTQNDQLVIHVRTHTGEKSYTCDICGKSFGYNKALRLHQLAHYREKVYKCTLCLETFNSKKTMKMHVRVHSSDSGASIPRKSPPIKPVIAISQDAATSCWNSSSSSSSSGFGSDKENKTDDSRDAPSYAPPWEFSHYLYPREQYFHQLAAPVGANPALLTAAAEDRTSFHQASPMMASLPTQPTEPAGYAFHHLYPAEAAATEMTAPEVATAAYLAYKALPGNELTSGDHRGDQHHCSLLDLPGNDVRWRRPCSMTALEAVKVEHQREPIPAASSYPVSPVPPLILPLLKHSKM